MILQGVDIFDVCYFLWSFHSISHSYGLTSYSTVKLILGQVPIIVGFEPTHRVIGIRL